MNLVWETIRWSKIFDANNSSYGNDRIGFRGNVDGNTCSNTGTLGTTKGEKEK